MDAVTFFASVSPTQVPSSAAASVAPLPADSPEPLSPPPPGVALAAEAAPESLLASSLPQAVSASAATRAATATAPVRRELVTWSSPCCFPVERPRHVTKVRNDQLP